MEEVMEALIVEAIKGNTQALSDLIIAIEEDLYKIARTRLSCEDDINEAVQQTIVQIFKSIKKLKEPKYFKTWTIKILINKCNKLYRKIQKNTFMEYDESIINLQISDENKIISNLDFFLLIKDLEYEERITCTLYYLERLTTKEISKILKEPESTTRNRKSRAVKKLQKKLMDKNPAKDKLKEDKIKDKLKKDKIKKVK